VSVTFKKWVLLEDIKKQLGETVEGVGFPEKVLDYLSIAYDRKPKEGYWKNTVFSMVEAFKEFSVDSSLPILNQPPSKSKDELDYPNRTWNFYSHILANSYGWTLEYISDLDTNEALGHIQEILTGEQLEREFIYSLSEIAYPYNKSTKKGEFKPLTRPYWMRPLSKPVKKVKIKRTMLPMGHIVDASGLGSELGGWNEIIQKNEETNSPRNPQPLSPPS
jgi:hypothetical protein